MKKFGTVAVLVFVSLTFVAQLPSQQIPAEVSSENSSEPKAKDAELERELVATLELAYDSYWAAFIAGEASFTDVLRIDRQLFEAQTKFADPDENKDIAQAHFDRAKRLEETASQLFASGVSTRQRVLDAKAARLQAAIELAKH